ncbi:MAG: GTPase Era [Alphaproteobacteria bacterium MarineAlpha4_Bin2]|mgnify:CR=1 FL=1|nr:MAG: GTPase Era [Alphaproteobacteria bacterium MarineAlpha4_Bin2]
MIDADEKRCGFVAVIGAPNAGKSTLVNRIVGAKVSIVTHKVQTTRIRVMGIVIRGGAQLVFIDTPGIFEPRRRLDRAMVDAAWRGAADGDIVLLLVDARRGIERDTRRIVEGLHRTNRKAILVLNKIDIVRRDTLLKLAAELNATGVIDETFMISALQGDGIDDVLDNLVKSVPVGPWMFPEDQISDLPQWLMAAEVTREQLFLSTHQEVPYSVTVETDAWEEFKDGSVKIDQSIYVQRDSQKAIILGRGGGRVRDIGSAARAELGDMLGRKVHLFIHVKVRDKWMDDRSRYSAWGLDFNA